MCHVSCTEEAKKTCSYHFRQQLGGQVMDGLTQNAQGGQDEDHSQDDTGSEEEEKQKWRKH